jgi:hypothetical protein
LGQSQANRSSGGVRIDDLSALGDLELPAINHGAGSGADERHERPKAILARERSCRFGRADRLAVIAPLEQDADRRLGIGLGGRHCGPGDWRYALAATAPKS